MESLMNTLTIRNIPQPVEKSLRMIAQKSHKSLNKTVIELLSRSTGVLKEEKKSKKKRDVLQVLTRWSDTEYKEFQKNTSSFTTIDEEIWH